MIAVRLFLISIFLQEFLKAKDVTVNTVKLPEEKQKAAQ